MVFSPYIILHYAIQYVNDTCFLTLFKIQTVAKTAGMHRNEWIENADRWVAGFLEMFEEGCHKMVSRTDVT